MQGRRGVARVALEEMLAGRRILQAPRTLGGGGGGGAQSRFSSTH